MMKSSQRKRLSVEKPGISVRGAGDGSQAQSPDSKQASRFKSAPLAVAPMPPGKPSGQRPANRSNATRQSADQGATDDRFLIELDSQEQQPFELGDLLTREWASRNSSFLISFALHTLLVLLFSLVVFHGTGKAMIVLELLTSPDVEESVGVVSAIEVLVDPADELIAAVDDDPFNMAFGDNEGDEQTADAGIIESTEGGGKSRAGQGDGKSAKFFGTRASGNSFVYVLDRSGSMGYEATGVAEYQVSRFDVARMELMNSVESLRPHQEFYVVLFSTEMKQMFNQSNLLPQPVKATPENKARLKDWLWSDVALGGTDPRGSLKLAFKMNPDAIFMLSDGEFSDERDDGNPLSIEITKKHVQEKTPIRIHSIALEDSNSKTNMEELSDASGGKFRFVTVADYVKSLGDEAADLFQSKHEETRLANLNDWKTRFESAQRLIKRLRSHDATVRQEAETGLHQLSFGLLEDSVLPIEESAGLATVVEVADQWESIWQNADTNKNPDVSTPAGLFARLTQGRSQGFLEFVEKLDMADLTPLQQLGLAKCILAFQTSPQDLNEKSRELLLKPLDELNKQSTASFGRTRFISSANYADCERRIKKVLSNRRNWARKIYTKANNKKILPQVRREHAIDLVRLYPETELARKAIKQWEIDLTKISSPINAFPVDDASSSFDN